MKRTTETTKRSFAKRLLAGAGSALLAAAFVAASQGPVSAGDKLTYFTWSGYELPDFHQAYMTQHPEGLDIPVFGDDDEALAKVKAGFHPDIAHPCFDKLPQWRDAGLLQPIDTSRLKNWDKIFPALKDLPGIVDNGQVWMVPWDWGNTSILYRTDLVKDPEQSWKLLWDKQYAGKLATIDAVHDTPVVAALLAGVDPFNMSSDDINKVADVLRQQRPLLRFYTTDMTSVEQALASGELVAAMTWNASWVTLTKQKIPVAFMNPKEKMLTWVCGMVLMKDSAHVDQAYDFINAELDAQSGANLITEYGYGSSSSEAFAKVPPDQLKALALPDNPETMLRNTVITGPMKNRDAISAMYEKVKAGG